MGVISAMVEKELGERNFPTQQETPRRNRLGVTKPVTSILALLRGSGPPPKFYSQTVDTERTCVGSVNADAPLLITVGSSLHQEPRRSYKLSFS